MYILGLGGSDHDISAALLKDGQIICAIEEERVTRKKYAFHSNLLLGHARKYLLNQMNLKMDDIDLVVADEILAKTALFSIRKNLHIVNHHLLHAASAFYPSGFDEAAILVVDNAGSLVEHNGVKGIETLTYAVGKGNKITVLDKIIGEKYKESKKTDHNIAYQAGDPDHSLGYFYKLISHYCNFNFLINDDYYFTEDGKTMGLAPYGTDKYYSLIKPHVKLEENGQIKLDLHSGNLQAVLKEITSQELSHTADFERRADIAWAGQKILEEALIHAAHHLYAITKLPYLCIAGGVGLNSVANGKILKNTPFDQLFIQPASGDNGTSLGAALWGYHEIKKQERPPQNRYTMHHAYLGPCYSDEEILKSLQNQSGISWEKPDNLVEQSAKYIQEGKIAGLFQDSSEYGPRALGHRSIIANPMLAEMKDHLNERVKFRESFRPFAPAVKYENQTEYFDIEQYTPFMLIVSDVKEDKREIIPAVTHVDYTARLQSVKKEAGGLFYSLIDEFHKLTGVPVLLNTSFNIKGEPIVETPQDAVKCFIETGIDFLIIGPFLVKKTDQQQ